MQSALGDGLRGRRTRFGRGDRTLVPNWRGHRDERGNQAYDVGVLLDNGPLYWANGSYKGITGSPGTRAEGLGPALAVELQEAREPQGQYTTR